MIKVVYLTPDFAADHLYITQLINYLRTSGVYLKTVKTKNFLKDVILFHPQIVHLHWLHSFSKTDEDKSSYFSNLINIAGLVMQLVIIRIYGIRIVWTVHELKIPESRYPALDNLCIKLVASLSTTIIAHCQNAKKAILDSGCAKMPEKITVIPHGHFVEVIDNQISAGDARRLLGIPESALVILFFGLIRPYKGVIELIESHRQLEKEDIFLLIVGGSVWHHKQCADYLLKVKQSISGRHNVHLVEKFVPDEQIQVFMNASDVVAFPYLEVMTSGALIAAMGFGKACIASRIGCIDETIDNEGAFLYDAADKLGLARSIAGCLEKRSRLKEMGEHNKRAVLKNNWRQIALDTLQIYKSGE